MACTFLQICRPLQRYFRGVFMYPTFLFYDSLTILASLQDSDVQNEMQIVESNLSQLKKLSKNAPENFENKCCLIEAEIANNGKAMTHYEKSIKLSKQNCFLHEEAISCERAALFLLRLGSTDTARQLLTQAYHCYKKWGAERKTAQLTKQYKHLLNGLSSTFGDSEFQVDNQSSGNISSLSSNSFKISVECKRLKP